MSFTGTPLNQGRRLDHTTFMNGTRNATSQHSHEEDPSNIESSRGKNKQSIPLSYAYGAPTLSNRSPQKPISAGHRNPSPTRSTRSSHRGGDEYEEESNESFSSARAKESGAVRYARLKQRNQALGPGTIISPPKPNGTNFKDTSVNIASAFNQAAAASMPANGRAARVSSSRTTKETYNANHTTTTAGREGLPGPPRRAGSKPVSKSHEVADSEDEELQIDGDTGRSISRLARAKSPLETVVEAVGGVVRALSPAATFFVRQKRGDHDDDESTYQSMVIPSDSQRSSHLTVPSHGSHGNLSADSSDYNYSREDAMVEAMDNSSKRAKKRGRISVDNKAYKPGGSDPDESSETDDNEPGGRRKKKKVKALVNNLPTIGYSSSKRKVPKKKGTKGSKSQANDDEASGPEVTPQPSIRGGSVIRSIRGSVPPPSFNDIQSDSAIEDDSMVMEDNLQDYEPPEPPSVLSEPEPDFVREPEAPRLTFGAALGKVVHFSTRAVWSLLYVLFRLAATFLLLIGHVGQAIYDTLLARPASWAMKMRDTLPWAVIGRSVVSVLALWVAIALLRTLPSPSGWIPALPSNTGREYRAPEIPPGSLEELIRRLSKVESSLSDVSYNVKLKSDAETKSTGHVFAKIASLESRIEGETRRATEAEEKYRSAAAKGLTSLRDEWQVLAAVATDKDLSSLKEDITTLEERLGHAEQSAKQAVDLSKQAATKAAAAPSAGWRNKWSSGSDARGMTIKSSDGTDVTQLITNLIDSSVSRISKDLIAKPDFALYSAGGKIIPRMTTDTYELQPETWGKYVYGYITNTGFAHGNSPVHAIHPDLSVGQCWPFAASSGQIGIKLSQLVHINEFTIDHVAKEVAPDIRSAPREIELWGLVEGRENQRKVADYHNKRKARYEAASEAGVAPSSDDEPYPQNFPRRADYLRLANNIAYDLHAPLHVQTFQISQEIRDLGVDFGIVVLRILSNWGEPDFTCLYRVRVHGTPKEQRHTPIPELEQ